MGRPAQPPPPPSSVPLFLSGRTRNAEPLVTNGARFVTPAGSRDGITGTPTARGPDPGAGDTVIHAKAATRQETNRQTWLGAEGLARDGRQEFSRHREASHLFGRAVGWARMWRVRQADAVAGAS
jgi:hypothetical protein